MLPNAPSERLPRTLSERFRTPFRTVPRTHPIPKGIFGAATKAAAPDLDAEHLSPVLNVDPLHRILL